MEDLKLRFFKAQRELANAKDNAEVAEKKLQEIKGEIDLILYLCHALFSFRFIESL